MNVVFTDPANWDYDVTTPLHRPLGGSQSALCYLASALAARGNRVSLVNSIGQPGELGGVHCYNRDHIAADVLDGCRGVVLLNGPADFGLKFRGMIPLSVPLILWTQVAHNQRGVQA